MVVDTFLECTMKPRVVYSCGWTTVLSLGWMLGALLTLLWAHNPLHPITAATDLTILIFSPSSWLLMLVYSGFVAFWSFHHSTTFSTTPSVLKSWANLITRLFLEPNNIASLWVNCLVCGGLGWSFLKLGPSPYSALTVPCPSDSEANICFNQHHLFLLLSSLFTGALLAIQYNFFSDNCLIFPIIFKEKSSQVKQKLLPMLLISMGKSVKVVKWFCILFIATSLVSVKDPFNFLLTYLDPLLLLTCVLLSCLLLLINNSRLLLFSTFSCEPLSLSLSECLETLDSDQSLLRLLGLQRLSVLCQQSPAARQSVFSLSQPGGHPHQWNAIFKSCLGAITDLTSSMSPVVALAQAPPAPAAALAPQVSVNPSIRRLAPALPPKQEAVPQAPGSASLPSHVNQLVALRLQALQSKPLICALFKVCPDHSIREAMARAQPVIWAIDCVSNLAAASVSEDRYGLVQKDLPQLLVALLELEQSLAKTRGLSLSLPSASSSQDILLRHQLKQTIKSALYRIVIKFGEHILEVPIPKEFKLKIESYQRFMES